MNKNLHRIVFNAKRGLRMVVQETAKSTGKGASKATSGASGAIAAGAAALAKRCGVEEADITNLLHAFGLQWDAGHQAVIMKPS